MATVATGNMPAVQGTPTSIDGNVKAAKTPEAAKKQIKEGYAALGQLLNDFDAVTSATLTNGRTTPHVYCLNDCLLSRAVRPDAM